ncbi:MAG: 4'-phosphopantetheinyl transferase superfamily protein [Flavobacteriales bacterium]
MAKKNLVKVYTTHISEPFSKDLFDRMMDTIPLELQEKVLEEEGWENQHGSLARKLMLWHGMNDFGANMNDLFESLQYTKTGKPFIIDSPNFSLANDGAVAVCAISETSVMGVDVARLKPINLNDYQEDFTYLEWREIYSHMIPLRRFYEFWTIKESVIKADGESNKPDLKEIYIQPDVAFSNGKNWYVYPVEIDYYGYVSYIVTSNPHADVEVVDIDLSKLF